MPFHIFVVREPVDVGLLALKLLLDLVRIFPLWNLALADIALRDSLIFDKVPLFVERPVLLGSILGIHGRRFAVVYVPEFLVPEMLSVFDDIDDLGVEGQRSICLGDLADEVPLFGLLVEVLLFGERW